MEYNIDTTNIVNPLDHIDKPLWSVYGSYCFPTIIACKINAKTGSNVIWGYSIWEESGAYRTLGTDLKNWIDRHDFAYFFTKKQQALSFLGKLITPKISKENFYD